MAVLRRNMLTRVVIGTNGRKAIIFGTAKSSSKTDLHEEAIEHMAQVMAESGDYAYVTIGDRSWRTATGRYPGASTLRPDVIGLDRNGRFTAYEVASQHDTEKELKRRLYEGQQSLPEELQGEIKAFFAEEALDFRRKAKSRVKGTK
jgi:hypothetical protein